MTGEWRAGGPVVAASMLGIALSALPNITMGVFVVPLEQEFGWKRAQITSGLMALGLFSVLFGPWVGHLIDRAGPRRVGIPGVVAFCAAIALLATVSGSIWHWWALWITVAAAYLFISVTLWASVVTRRFTRHRGLALSVMLSGASLASAVVPLLVSLLIAEVGWRLSYVALAAGALALALPMMILFLDDGRHGTKGKILPDPDGAQSRGYSLSEAARSKAFFQILGAAFAVVLVVNGTIVHLIPYLEAQNLGRTSASLVAGLVGIFSLIGRIGGGLLLDRFRGSLIGGIAFVLPAATAAILWFAGDSLAMVIVATCLLGLAFGAEIDVLAYLTSRYFGLRHYGVIFGVVAGVIAAGSSGGPAVAGAIYDRTGSYEGFFLLAAAVSIAGAALIACLGPYPAFEAAKPAD